jgi:hypothetical protein
MNNLSRLVISAILACVSADANFSKASPAQVVFDNTGNPIVQVGGPMCCQVGNEVALTGTARYIVGLSWLVSSQGFDARAAFEAHIYANDGPDSAPGTLLWDSGPVTHDLLATDMFFDIEVPRVLVPDTITVTTLELPATPVGVNRYFVGPPTEGSYITGWLERSYLGPADWVQQYGPWGLRVLAVPEPSSLSLVIGAGVLLLGVLGLPKSPRQTTQCSPSISQTSEEVRVRVRRMESAGTMAGHSPARNTS